MMKLLRLGYKIEHVVSDNDDLLVRIECPKGISDTRVACNNVTTLPTFAAVESIEIACQDYMKRNRL